MGFHKEQRQIISICGNERNDPSILLDEMRAITEDPVRYKSFLMKSSMIEGVRQAAAIT